MQVLSIFMLSHSFKNSIFHVYAKTQVSNPSFIFHVYDISNTIPVEENRYAQQTTKPFPLPIYETDKSLTPRLKFI